MDADPAGAFALAYDSARKALTAILVNQGLRAGGDGTHAVLLEAVRAQLDPPLGPTFRPFGWMRPLRNHTEYPSPDHPSASAEDVHEAVPAATAIRRLWQSLRSAGYSPWLEASGGGIASMRWRRSMTV